MTVAAHLIPAQRRPDARLEDIRARVQTLHGLAHHYCHLAEEAALLGDAHHRDVNLGKAHAYKHMAHELNAILWPGEADVA